MPNYRTGHNPGGQVTAILGYDAGKLVCMEQEPLPDDRVVAAHTQFDRPAVVAHETLDDLVVAAAVCAGAVALVAYAAWSAP